MGAEIVVCIILGFISGCTFLFGLNSLCELPGFCGQSGRLLFTMAENASVNEIDEVGRGHFFTSLFQESRGFAFLRTSQGLRLLVAGEDGLRDLDGRIAGEPRVTVDAPDCTAMGDVVVLPDGNVVATCVDTNRLIKIDPETGTVVSEFVCCETASSDFDPVALTVTEDGAILAGRTRILAFDGTSGEFLMTAVEAGVEGAASYDDVIIASNGNLLVSANADIGVLEFDGTTFEFVRVLVPGGEDGVPTPRALAFDPDGNLLVGSGIDAVVYRFDPSTGEPAAEPQRVATSGSVAFAAFRP